MVLHSPVRSEDPDLPPEKLTEDSNGSSFTRYFEDYFSSASSTYKRISHRKVEAPLAPTPPSSSPSSSSSTLLPSPSTTSPATPSSSSSSTRLSLDAAIQQSLSSTVKSLVQETRCRTAVIGCKGSGKSFLLNTLLEATAPSEKDYADLLATDPHILDRPTESRSPSSGRLSSPQFSGSYSRSTLYRFDSPSSYSFSEDKSYGSATAYSFHEGAPAYRPAVEEGWAYTQATSYSFAPSSDKDGDEQWEMGEVEETFVPDQHYATSIDWKKERARPMDDEHCFLIPQGLHQLMRDGPRCIGFRYGKIPELVVSFADESKVRIDLFSLHDPQWTSLASKWARQSLEAKYRTMLGIKDDQKIPLSSIQSSSDFQLRDDVKRVLGKTYRFRGAGRSFVLDRLYIRQKMREIIVGYGHCVTNVLVKMPCKILEGNRELIEVENATVSDGSLRSIRDANVLIVLVGKDGLSSDLQQILKESGFLQALLGHPDKHRALFVESLKTGPVEGDGGIESKSFEYSINLQLQRMLAEEKRAQKGTKEAVTADSKVLSVQANVLSVYPRLFSMLKSVEDASHSMETTVVPTATPSESSLTAAEAMRRTNIPALLGYITNMVLAQCAKPFKEMNRSWVEQQFGSNVTSSLVSRISGLTLGTQQATEAMTMPDGLTDTLAQLATSFQDRFSNWKGELMGRVVAMDEVLQPKVKECLSRARTDWVSFRDQFLQTNEACRVVLDPQMNGRALGADMSQFACGLLMGIAPRVWNERIAQIVPSKIEEMLLFSQMILEECVKTIERSECESEAEKAKLSKLLIFCRGTHEKAVIRFAEFKKQIQLDISPIVKDACADALQVQVLTRSSAIQGVKNYHNLVVGALPDIPIAAAKNILQKFSEKLQSDLEQLDVAEKDLQRAIRCVMVVLKSKPNGSKSTEIPSAPASPSIGTTFLKKDKESKLESIVAMAESYQKIHDDDMELSRLRVGLSTFDEKDSPQYFTRDVWMSHQSLQLDISKLRFLDQVKKGNLNPVQVKPDGNCQFRTLAYHVYGTEEAHSIVRLLVMSEILCHPATYEKFISIKGMELQEYVSMMARDGSWGDHLTLCAFANFYGADLVVYSPIFSNPLLIQSKSPQTNRVLCIAFVSDNQYQPLLSTAAPSTTTTTEKDSMEVSSTTAGNTSAVAPSVDTSDSDEQPLGHWYYLSDAIVKSEAPSLSGLKSNKMEVRTTKVFTPKSLATMCVMKIGQCVDLLPCLDGALPEELVQHILSLVIEQRRMDDSVLERLLDSSIRFLVLDNSLQITDQSCRLIARTCPQLTRISLANCILLGNEGLVHLACTCPSLEIVNLSGCSGIGNLGVQELARRCPQLQSVNLSGCAKITDIAITELSLACSHLHTLLLKDCIKLSDNAFTHIGQGTVVLDASGCELITDSAIDLISKKCNYLASFKASSRGVTDASVLQLAKSCPSLRTLDLNGCELVSDESVKSLAQHCPLLETLTLACCRNVTFMSITMVQNPFQNLLSLDLTRCLNVVDAAVQRIAMDCLRLEVFNLSSCEDITDACVLEVAKHCRGLREVNLSKCMNVTDASVIQLASMCSGIRKLVLYNCHKLTDASMAEVGSSCRQLRELDLSSCQGLTDNAIQFITQGCPFLEVLGLEECKVTEQGIQAIAAHCYCLKSLKVAYSKGMTDKSLHLLAAGCPHMVLLDLSYCTRLSVEALQEALRCWTSLKTLNLRGFHQITSEAFWHPSIQTLNLSWCKNVQDTAIEQLAGGFPSLVQLDLAWAGKITANVIHKLVQTVPTLRYLNLRGCTKVSLLALKYLSSSNIVVYS